VLSSIHFSNHSFLFSIIKAGKFNENSLAITEHPATLKASKPNNNEQLWGNPWSRGRMSDSQLGDPGLIPTRSK
jgi:hypothetical protein